MVDRASNIMTETDFILTTEPGDGHVPLLCRFDLHADTWKRNSTTGNCSRQRGIVGHKSSSVMSTEEKHVTGRKSNYVGKPKNVSLKAKRNVTPFTWESD